MGVYVGRCKQCGRDHELIYDDSGLCSTCTSINSLKKKVKRLEELLLKDKG